MTHKNKSTERKKVSVKYEGVKYCVAPQNVEYMTEEVFLSSGNLLM